MATGEGVKSLALWRACRLNRVQSKWEIELSQSTRLKIDVAGSGKCIQGFPLFQAAAWLPFSLCLRPSPGEYSDFKNEARATLKARERRNGFEAGIAGGVETSEERASMKSSALSFRQEVIPQPCYGLARNRQDRAHAVHAGLVTRSGRATPRHGGSQQGRSQKRPRQGCLLQPAGRSPRPFLRESTTSR